MFSWKEQSMISGSTCPGQGVMFHLGSFSCGSILCSWPALRLPFVPGGGNQQEPGLWSRTHGPRTFLESESLQTLRCSQPWRKMRQDHWHSGEKVSLAFGGGQLALRSRGSRCTWLGTLPGEVPSA
ncbi:hypothetical protein HJG60_009132 [Phyllostomus discolor]|uniref:Uncharacterized protein n=1 Tax=Phyllostomus discolor TaxID=89673 RepID=A0A834DFQ7_9CHIR|nr:hypothetical protein HJG60_009132 [Phyllostomus discolor]